MTLVRHLLVNDRVDLSVSHRQHDLGAIRPAGTANLNRVPHLGFHNTVR